MFRMPRNFSSSSVFAAIRFKATGDGPFAGARLFLTASAFESTRAAWTFCACLAQLPSEVASADSSEWRR